MSKNTIITGVVILAVVIGLFSLSSFLSPNKKIIDRWNGLGVECLPNGHANLAQHIHQRIRVIIDGVDTTVPANVGVLTNCLAEMHTHEGEPNLIHVESAEPLKEFSVRDFFGVWGESFDKPNMNVTVLLSGATTTEGGDLILRDNQIVDVVYVGSSQEKAQ